MVPSSGTYFDICCILKLHGRKAKMARSQPLTSKEAFPVSIIWSPQKFKPRRETTSTPGFSSRGIPACEDIAGRVRNRLPLPKWRPPLLGPAPHFDPFSLPGRGERKSCRDPLHYLQSLSHSIKMSKHA